MLKEGIMSYWKVSTTVIIAVILLLTRVYGVDAYSTFDHFITVRGDRLYDGARQFRFISFNTPNLLCIEDNMSFIEKNAWRLPNLFEIDDALKTIKQMGGKVTRSYVITVRRADDARDIPRYVMGPGKFNEDAFVALDQVLASANRIGVRLIIPFVDNWKWMGGKDQYANFRGKKPGKFWSDKTLKADYKKTIAFVLNRVNTITGFAYKDDKAILAWELGNELRTAPAEWISEMAHFIKSIDGNHLVNEGIQMSLLSDAVVNNPDIDILSTHHYAKNPLKTLNNIKLSAAKAKGKKPYYVGEIGFISTNALQAILSYLTKEKNISGIFVWSLRFHNRDGGFYWHSEPLGTGYKAYHYPGFYSGRPYDEKNVFHVMRDYAGKINNSIVRIQRPEAPFLLPIKDIAHISWQGAVGADYYQVERAQSAKGPWKLIGNNISDAASVYASLYKDRQAEHMKNYFYRVFAINIAGKSSASNIVGPVHKKHETLLDKMENYGKLFNLKGDITLQTRNTRNFKEDFHRMAGKNGAEIIYYVPGRLKKCRINIFKKDDAAVLNLYMSEEGRIFKPVTMESRGFSTGKNDYQYWKPVQIKAESIAENNHYLKLKFINAGQIGRVEIEYAN